MTKAVNPAGELNRELTHLVTAMSDREFAALGALCVERVQLMIVAFFGSSTLAEEVRALLWEVVEHGSSRSDAAELRQRLEDEISSLYEADETGYPMHVTRLMSEALARVARREWDTDESVVLDLQDAARSAGLDREDEVMIEEARWALAAVHAIQRERPLTKSAIERMSTTPSWMAKFLQENRR